MGGRGRRTTNTAPAWAGGKQEGGAWGCGWGERQSRWESRGGEVTTKQAGLGSFLVPPQPERARTTRGPDSHHIK